MTKIMYLTIGILALSNSAFAACAADVLHTELLESDTGRQMVEKFNCLKDFAAHRDADAIQANLDKDSLKQVENSPPFVSMRFASNPWNNQDACLRGGHAVLNQQFQNVFDSKWTVSGDKDGIQAVVICLQPQELSPLVTVVTTSRFTSNQPAITDSIIKAMDSRAAAGQ